VKLFQHLVETISVVIMYVIWEYVNLEIEWVNICLILTVLE
jgi:hypothetical protein